MNLHKAVKAYINQMNQETYDWLIDRGLKNRTIEEAFLGYVQKPEEGHWRFQGCISIPYLAASAKAGLQLQALRFRRLTGLPKYDNPAGTKTHLYNVSATGASGHVYITEGEFDCLILKQLGLNACGIPGAKNFKPAWKWLFLNCDQVSIVTDGDDEGKKAAHRISSILGAVADNTRIIELPPGEDVNSLYLKSPIALERLLQ